MRLLHARTRLAERRVLGDRECFDKQKWWRERTCHRTLTGSDEVDDFDARSFSWANATSIETPTEA